jgi:hypothetical protein
VPIIEFVTCLYFGNESVHQLILSFQVSVGDLPSASSDLQFQPKYGGSFPALHLMLQPLLG